MLTFNSEQLRRIVKDADSSPAVASQVDAIDFQEFSHLEDSVKSDVAFLRENPLVLKETTVTGWVYEVETGKVCYDVSTALWLRLTCLSPQVRQVV